MDCEEEHVSQNDEHINFSPSLEFPYSPFKSTQRYLDNTDHKNPGKGDRKTI